MQTLVLAINGIINKYKKEIYESKTKWIVCDYR